MLFRGFRLPCAETMRYVEVLMENSPSNGCIAFHSWIDLLKSQVESHDSDTAFIFLDEEGNEGDLLTYGELDQRAQAIAHNLKGTISKGDRVLLLHPPGLDYIVSFYGCLYAGAVAVPLFPPHRNRIEHVDIVARDCSASMVLSTEHVVSEMEKLDDKWYVKSLPRMASDDITETVLPIEGMESSESEIAYLQYTSGSTSTPKGVIVEHEMMLRQCDELGYGWGVDTETVLVSWLPHFHDFGQVSGVLMPIYSGTRAVLMAPATFVKSPIRWLSAVSTYRGTHSGAPNFAFDLCVSKTTPSQRAELDLSSWRLVSNGAEPVRKATLERFQEAFEPHGLPATAVTPGYGLAEATLKVTSGTSDVAFSVASFDESALGRRKVLPAEGEGTIELVGCGHTVMDTEIAIVEPES
ncbi:AMP-binding protein, partial [Nocardia sp. CNY236]|uniref:AMP-binding protein n=1 Tax=Nocardia sp. CNY236 TaxID=1169152 RepID=UPI0012DF753F